MITADDIGKKCVWTDNKPTDKQRFWMPGVIQNVVGQMATIRYWSFEFYDAIIPIENVIVTSPAPLPPNNFLAVAKPFTSGTVQ